MNEYEPWAALGQTEAEYFRARYIEHGKEIERLKRAIERLRSAMIEADFALSNPDAGEEAAALAIESLKDAISCDRTEGES